MVSAVPTKLTARDLLRENRRVVLTFVVVSVGLGVALVAAEMFLGFALNYYLTPSKANYHPGLISWLFSGNGIWGGGTVVVLAGLIRTGIVWLEAYFDGYGKEYVRLRVRSKVIEASYRGRITSSATGLTYFGESALQAVSFVSAVHVTITAATSAAAAFAFLCWLSPQSTGILLAGGIVAAALIIPLTRSIERRTDGIHHLSQAMYRRITLGIRNLVLLRVYAMSERELEQGRADLIESRDVLLQQWGRIAAMVSGPNVAGLLFLVLPLTFTMRSATGAGASTIAYLYLTVRLLNAAGNATRSYSYTTALSGVAFRMFEWMALDDRAVSQTQARLPARSVSALPDLDATKPFGWEIDNVSFRYPGATQDVFSNLSLSVPAGRCTVIEGPSGAGKSTLLAILLGLEKGYSGTVRAGIGSKMGDAGDVLERASARVGYVGAESFLVDGTLRENLFYGLLEPRSDEQVARALAQAHCEFVHSLPSGLNHTLQSQGEGLSAGQRQRICLARALLRNPTVLVLDEATANLDYETERQLVADLAKLQGTVTLLVVTHRPAFAVIANQTIVLGKLRQAA